MPLNPVVVQDARQAVGVQSVVFRLALGRQHSTRHAQLDLLVLEPCVTIASSVAAAVPPRQGAACIEAAEPSPVTFNMSVSNRSRGLSAAAAMQSRGARAAGPTRMGSADVPCVSFTPTKRRFRSFSRYLVDRVPNRTSTNVFAASVTVVELHVLHHWRRLVNCPRTAQAEIRPPHRAFERSVIRPRSCLPVSMIRDTTFCRCFGLV
jgi:hypothetical protein